jgi:hypothetical protein
VSELKCAEKVRRHLVEHGIAYEVTEHREAFTAQEMAAALHEPGSRVAKAVMLMADGELVMAVLAAPDHVSLKAARAALGRRDVRLATEDVCGVAFPDCDLGAAVRCPVRRAHLPGPALVDGRQPGLRRRQPPALDASEPGCLPRSRSPHRGRPGGRLRRRPGAGAGSRVGFARGGRGGRRHG